MGLALVPEPAVVVYKKVFPLFLLDLEVAFLPKIERVFFVQISLMQDDRHASGQCILECGVCGGYMYPPIRPVAGGSMMGVRLLLQGDGYTPRRSQGEFFKKVPQQCRTPTSCRRLLGIGS